MEDSECICLSVLILFVCGILNVYNLFCWDWMGNFSSKQIDLFRIRMFFLLSSVSAAAAAAKSLQSKQNKYWVCVADWWCSQEVFADLNSPFFNIRYICCHHANTLIICIYTSYICQQSPSVVSERPQKRLRPQSIISHWNMNFIGSFTPQSSYVCTKIKLYGNLLKISFYAFLLKLSSS